MYHVCSVVTKHQEMGLTMVRFKSIISEPTRNLKQNFVGFHFDVCTTFPTNYMKF